MPITDERGHCSFKAMSYYLYENENHHYEIRHRTIVLLLMNNLLLKIFVIYNLT